MELVSVIFCVIITLCPQINGYKRPSDVCPQGSIYINASKISECPQNDKYTLIAGEDLCITINKNHFVRNVTLTHTGPPSKDILNRIIYRDNHKEFTVTFGTNVTLDFPNRWTYIIEIDSPYKNKNTKECNVDFRVLSPPLVVVSNTTLKPIASKRTEEDQQQSLYLIYKYKYTPGTMNVSILYNNNKVDKPKTNWVVISPITGVNKGDSDTKENYGRVASLNLHERDNNTFIGFTFDGNGIKLHLNITFFIDPVSELQLKNFSKTVTAFERFLEVLKPYLDYRLLLNVMTFWKPQETTRNGKALNPPKKSKKKKPQYNKSPKKIITTTTTMSTKAPTTTTETNLKLKDADDYRFPMTVNEEIKENDFVQPYEKDSEINIICNATIYAKDETTKQMINSREINLYICELKLNGDVERLHFPPVPVTESQKNVVTNITFTADETYNGKTIICAVLHKTRKSFLRRSVEMRMIMTEENEVTTNSSPEIDTNAPMSSPNQAGESAMPWFWYAVIGGACVIVILIVALIKIVLNRSKKKEPTSYKNFTSDDAPNFPNTPKLEETYCTPSDNNANTSERIYSQPFKTKDPAELYSVPTPKHKRNKNKDNTDGHYAELTFGKLDKNNDYSLYSEISSEPNKNCNKKNNLKEETDDYINVFENETYVNSKSEQSEDKEIYNEPNYCEVRPWH